MKCFKRPLRRKHWTVSKFSSGLHGSKEEKWALKIILILGARQQPVPTRISKTFEKKSTRIVGTQLTRPHKLQVWVGVPVSGFWPWIWIWDALPRGLFSACSHRTGGGDLVWLRARSCKIRLKVTQTFFLRSSRATKVGAMGTTLRPNKLRANGRRPLHRDLKKQDKWGQMWKRYSFPPPKDVRGVVHRELVPPRQTVNQDFTLRFWGDWKRMCEENSQNCGDWVIGFSVMTTPQLTQLCLWPSIWPLRDGASFPTHPIHRI